MAASGFADKWPRRWRLMVLVLLLRPVAPAPVGSRPNGAPLFDASRGPLRTSGRYIVDRFNERVKWACANWHGLEQETHVPGGLDTVQIAVLLERIAELGFNCVRLPVSVDAVLLDPAINNSCVAANRQFEGITWRQMFNATVAALAEARLMVIVDRHMLKSGNNPGNNSLVSGQWHGKGITMAENLRSLEILADMTRSNPYVVGFEPINEPHDFNGSILTWGGGDPKTDLHMYYQTAGNAILAKNPDVLIVVDGMCASKTFTFFRDRWLNLSSPNRIVYSPHTYVFFLLTGIMSSNSSAIRWLRWWSWPLLERILSVVAAFWAACALGLAFAWRRLGWPLPAKSAWLASTAAWFSVSALGAMSFQSTVWYFQTYGVGYCGYLASSEVTGSVFAFLALTAAGALVSAAGCLIYIRSAAAREEFLEEPFLEMGDTAPRDSQHSPPAAEAAASVAPALSVADVADAAATDSCAPAARQAGRQSRRGNGTCLRMQALLLSVTLASWSMYGAMKSHTFASDTYLESEYDRMWGYLTQEGQPYTGPVFISEFGSGFDSEWFQRTVRYIARRDLDWAYWPLNPVRPFGGTIDGGGYHPGPHPERWVEDTWSVLDTDWRSLRNTWRLERLRPIMRSPPSQPGDVVPCPRSQSDECGN